MSKRTRWVQALVCVGVLCLPILVWAQSPQARQRAEEWSALVRSMGTAQKLHTRRSPERVDSARQVRQKLERYAESYLDLDTGNSKYEGVILWLRGMTYYWEGRVARARIDFEDCLRKAERQDCLGKPCAVECERGLKLLRARAGEPGFRVTQDFKSGHTELSLEPQSFERTAEQTREVASRLIPRGEFDNKRALIDGALGEYAAKADVAVSDELVLYRLEFSDLEGQGKPAAKLHSRLLEVDRYLGELLGTAPLSTRENTLMVYVVTSPPWEQEYREIPRRLHHFQVAGTSYFEPLDNSATVISSLPEPVGTLRHEFVHAVLDADFPGAPKWLDEGVAAFHEAGKYGFKADGSLQVMPYGNWRINLLVDGRNRLRQDLPTLKTLVDPNCQSWSTDYYLVAGAYSRYFVWYLYQKGALKEVYERLRDGESSLEVLAELSRDLSFAAEGSSQEEALAALEADVRVFLRKRARHGGNVKRRFYADLGHAAPTCSEPEVASFVLEEGVGPGPELAPEPEETPTPAPEEQPPEIEPPPRRGCAIGHPGFVGFWLLFLGLVLGVRRAAR
jgi:hypothetical protein